MNAERRRQAEPPDEDLPRLRSSVQLAQEMGAGLGERGLLFGRVQEEAVTASANIPARGNARRSRSELSNNYAFHLILLGLTWLSGLIASGWSPFDRQIWWMEVAPVLLIYPLLIASRRRVRLSALALVLIAFHGLVLMLGGAYTYARVPVGFLWQDWLHLARNPYDRFGHLMQGFVPAIVVRELLLTKAGAKPRRFLTLTVLAYCLALSAFYELIEFGTAMALGQGADAFLGTQGDPWDTQWDMLMCLIGAALSLALLSRVQDRLLRRQRESRAKLASPTKPATTSPRSATPRRSA